MAGTTGDDLSGENEADNAVYRSLIYSISQISRETTKGFIIGIVSPGNEFGTDILVHELVTQLGSYPTNRVLEVDLGFVTRTASSVDDLFSKIQTTASPNVFKLWPESKQAVPPGNSTFWHGSAAHRRECLDRLRGEFQYILVKCPPLNLTSDALGVAPMLDGFLMVIEAGKTTTGELQAAEQAIESAGGKLLGSVLNQAKNSLPKWAGGQS